MVLIFFVQTGQNGVSQFLVSHFVPSGLYVKRISGKRLGPRKSAGQSVLSYFLLYKQELSSSKFYPIVVILLLFSLLKYFFLKEFPNRLVFDRG
ncbi:hypothetical protein OUZ56_020591 [Daphnia magna]|uniref:Uncharacterized protein n=1 Tax=Daphnia magna TaxID=35525 RepID=A0ABQ9ZEW8_9CRUS|nr:hypothetical protein OUZ56_020591 [Daphnia magna]